MWHDLSAEVFANRRKTLCLKSFARVREGREGEVVINGDGCLVNVEVGARLYPA